MHSRAYAASSGTQRAVIGVIRTSDARTAKHHARGGRFRQASRPRRNRRRTSSGLSRNVSRTRRHASMRMSSISLAMPTIVRY